MPHAPSGSDGTPRGGDRGCRPPSSPLWNASRPVIADRPLHRDVSVDVCVIGAGITGVSTALALCSEGLAVALIDDGPIGGGETGRTTAHLTLPDDGFERLIRLHGEERSRLYVQSHARAIDVIEERVKAERIECDFQRVDGFLFQAAGDRSSRSIDREHDAALRLGVVCELLGQGPLPGFGPAIRFPNQAQFHPLKYLAALIHVIERMGGQVFTGAHAASLESGARVTITTAHGPVINAGAAVVATNTPVFEKVAMHTKQAPFQTYAIAARIPAGAVPRALYWDTEDPYHYARTQPDDDHPAHEFLIVGGEDHKTGQASDQDQRWRRLEDWARAHFPHIIDVPRRWSGEVFEPVDAIAFIGREPLGQLNVYIATGDSGNGMTHGTIASTLLCDLIAGREHPWADMYNPARKNLSSVGVFVKENLNVALQYADWVLPAERASADDIAPGEGAVLRERGKPIAVFRDDAGLTHPRSAVCPHLGCIVSWNPGERTWDCPCHGSRFNCFGEIITGPANRDLAEVEQPTPSPAAGQRNTGPRPT